MEEDDLQRLQEAGSMVSFVAGKVLIEHGQPGTGLFVVMAGYVLVEAPDVEREFGPGAVIGERALLSPDGKRTARVRAVSDGVMLAVDRAEIDRICAEDPAFGVRLARES